MHYWFTSDCHLGHHNIIRYCSRPFRDVNHMNEVIISNWNSRVKPEDTVFHLGDFCFKNSAGGKEGEGLTHKASHYRDQLNGNIVFIKGNHDKNNSVRTIIDHMVIKYGPHYVNCVHNPEDFDDRFALNFVGHVHEKWKMKRVYMPTDEKPVDLINVGVDQWGFKPVSFEEIYNVYRVWARSQSSKSTNKTVESNGSEGLQANLV